ncbi:hypothetical protein SAMN05444405_12416 [Bacteroides luti]|uniref:Uncharacterized protein n=1 Tax=Bacteroides luti TaxID=1297750 RepID=A0A1M5H6M2_9BACE|nr:hypothetical protein SAMN05444405_12416 [Bacteroides luti]
MRHIKSIHRLFDESVLYSKSEISVIPIQAYKRNGLFVNKSISSTEIKSWHNIKMVYGHDFNKIKLLRKKH